MSRKVRISESQLNRVLVRKINEQYPTTSTQLSGGIETLKTKSAESESKLKEAQQKYPCINPKFVLSYQFFLENKKYDERFLKVALGVIGRESSFASGRRYETYGFGKEILNTIGFDVSAGPAQMKASTAKDLGIGRQELLTFTGALDSAYRYLTNSYKRALTVGYTSNQPSTIGSKGTGDAALDISIASYNKGGDIITQWCKTTNPNICVECNKITQGKKVFVPNYIPNYGTDKKVPIINQTWVGTTTRGYVEEVSTHYKKMTC